MGVDDMDIMEGRRILDEMRGIFPDDPGVFISEAEVIIYWHECDRKDMELATKLAREHELKHYARGGKFMLWAGQFSLQKTLYSLEGG